MTDIVERLRQQGGTNLLGYEAADEIERLRRDLEIWRRNGGHILREAEIERLGGLHSALVDLLRLKDAEIERLRNESHADEQRYQAAKEQAGLGRKRMAEIAAEERDRLHAENEGLQARIIELERDNEHLRAEIEMLQRMRHRETVTS